MRGVLKHWHMKTLLPANGSHMQGGCRADDKPKFENAVKDTLAWLDMNPLAEKEEFNNMRTRLEGLAALLMKDSSSSSCQANA